MDITYLLPKALRKIFNKAAVRNSVLNVGAKIDCGSTVVNSSLGRFTYIGEHTSMLNTEVGSFTSISNYCAIGGGNHPVDWISTSPVFNSSNAIIKKKLGKLEYNPFTETYIGNDVWIGSHCLIKSGIHIADGAVIGMGSVVLKDVGPYEIWAGNPAQIIRKRFGEEQITQLCNIKWWEWEEKKLKEKSKFINNVKMFLEENNG